MSSRTPPPLSSPSSVSWPAWEPSDFIPVDTATSQQVEFVIEIFVFFPSTEGRGRDATYNLGLAEVSYNSFRVQRDHVLNENTSWSTISSMLTLMDIMYQDQPVLIQEILSRARSIANQSRNVNRQTVPMTVYITGVRSPEELMGEVPVLRAASSKSPMDALTMVQVKGSEKQCVICLEELLEGTEAASLPCLHVYHKDCIRGWLHNSNACPLCRTHMPR